MISIGSSIDLVKKGWGEEVVVVNNANYCGKILRFNRGAKFSSHFHVEKHETFFIFKGALRLFYYDLRNADKKERTLNVGDVVTIPQHEPHQIEALEDSIIIEFSTHHEDGDSYRIEKGDSQRCAQ